MANKKFVSLTGQIAKTLETEAGSLTANNITLVYDSEVAYAKNNIVEYNGKLYKANGTIPARKTVAAGTSDSDWALVAGGGLEEWQQSQAYKRGDVVWTGDKIYKANGTIPANSVIKVGSYTDSDASWTLLSTSGAVGVEYGQASLAADVTVSSGIVTLVSFTLPSAGTWEVTYVANPDATSSGTVDQFDFYIANSTPTIISGSSQRWENDSTANDVNTVTNTVRITTTGAESFTFRTSRNSGSASFLTTGTKVLWKKISGFLPATGAITSYVAMSKTGTQAITGNGQDITWQTRTGTLTTTSTSVSLLAGVTYEINISLASGLSAETSVAAYFKLLNASTGADLGLPQTLLLPVTWSGSGYVSYPASSIIYTPTSDIAVKLSSASVTGTTTLNTDCSWTVKQLGTTNTSGFTGVVQNSWSIANTYPSGSIVLKDDFLYQANSTILAGTAFTLGTTGATWKMVNQQTAEYGSAGNTSDITVGGTELTIATASIPSAGVWELTYFVGARATSVTTADEVDFWIENASNVEQTNSRQTFKSDTDANDSVTIANSIFVTTSGAATYNIRAIRVSAAGGCLVESGRAKIVWRKVSGFLPLSAGEPAWTNGGTIQSFGITAPTTAPTLATNALQNRIYYKQIGVKTWQVTGIYQNPVSGTSGAVAGSGDYILTLPLGLQFDTSLPFQAVYSTAISGGSDFNSLLSIIPGGYSTSLIPGSGNTSGYTGGIIPYSATQYRVHMSFGSGTPTCWGSSVFAVTNNNLRVMWQATFQVA